MIGAIALGIPLSAIGARYLENTWLQVGPVAILLPAAIWLLRRCPLSNPAAVCMAAFVLLHLLAARWSYSFVPYASWADAIGADGWFSPGRNMFDRIVHFIFGLLAVLPFAEVCIRHGRMSVRASILVGLLFVLAVGGLYEIFEWLLVMTLSPADAGAYNGEQGDRFDSQKDMAIAALGALAALPLAGRRLSQMKLDSAETDLAT